MNLQEEVQKEFMRSVTAKKEEWLEHCIRGYSGMKSATKDEILDYLKSSNEFELATRAGEPLVEFLMWHNKPVAVFDSRPIKRVDGSYGINGYNYVPDEYKGMIPNEVSI